MAFPNLTGTRVNGEERVTLSFPWGVMLALALMAGGTIFAVWDATGDLSDSVDRLTATLIAIEKKVDEGEHERHKLDTRISVLESQVRGPG